MIGIENQYVTTFNIGDLEDFILSGDLISFNLIEEAGAVLPTFKLSFTLREEKVLEKINEGNNFKVSMGKTSDVMVDTKLMPTKVYTRRLGDHSIEVNIIGTYSAPKYLTENRIEITDKQSGIEAMSAAAKRHFIVDAKPTKSEDRQHWIQHNITDKKFIGETWLRSYKSGSFILVGISSYGDFIIRDARTLIGGGAKWTFSNEYQGEGSDIVMGDGLQSVSNTGFLNYFLGYGRDKLLNEIDAGTSSMLEVNPEDPMLVKSSSLPRNSETSKRFDLITPIGKNVHDNYWKAYLKNLTNLASFSSFSSTIWFRDRFRSIKVLDVVMVREDSTEDKKLSCEYLSGLYIVTKVVRSIDAQSFITTLTLNRESMNSMTGDLR